MLGSATDFSVIGPPPTRATTPFTPCDRLEVEDPTACVYVTPPSAIAKSVWGQVPPSYSYDGNASTEWTFTCSLQVDPRNIVVASQIVTQNWAFPTHAGHRDVYATQSASLAGSASPADAGGTLRLTGTVVPSRPLRLGRARVVRQRLLYERGGAGELVRRRSGGRLAPLTLARP